MADDFESTSPVPTSYLDPKTLAQMQLQYLQQKRQQQPQVPILNWSQVLAGILDSVSDRMTMNRLMHAGQAGQAASNAAISAPSLDGSGSPASSAPSGIPSAGGGGLFGGVGSAMSNLFSGAPQTGAPSQAAPSAPSLTSSAPTAPTGQAFPSMPDNADLDDGYRRAVGQIESGNNPNIGWNRSGNRGLYQFGPEEERKYGLNEKNWNDPNAQNAALRKEAQEHSKLLASKGIDPTAANLYLTHQQGVAGGPALLQADADTPAWQAVRPFYKSDAVAKSAISNNIYPGMPGYGKPADQITASEFRMGWQGKFGRTYAGNSQMAPYAGQATAAPSPGPMPPVAPVASSAPETAVAPPPAVTPTASPTLPSAMPASPAAMAGAPGAAPPTAPAKPIVPPDQDAIKQYNNDKQRADQLLRSPQGTPAYTQGTNLSEELRKRLEIQHKTDPTTGYDLEGNDIHGWHVSGFPRQETAAEKFTREEAAKTEGQAKLKQTELDQKYFHSIYTGLTGSATIAAQQKQNIAALRDIAADPTFMSGWGSNAGLAMQRLGAQFGIGDLSRAAPREAFNMLAARVLADQFSGMKSMSSETGEQAARIFKPMLDIEEKANITSSDSLEGIKSKLNLLDKAGDLMMKWGDMADDYKVQHGALDPGFNKQLRSEVAKSRLTEEGKHIVEHKQEETTRSGPGVNVPQIGAAQPPGGPSPPEGPAAAPAAPTPPPAPPIGPQSALPQVPQQVQADQAQQAREMWARALAGHTKPPGGRQQGVLSTPAGLAATAAAPFALYGLGAGTAALAPPLGRAALQQLKYWGPGAAIMGGTEPYWAEVAKYLMGR